MISSRVVKAPDAKAKDATLLASMLAFSSAAEHMRGGRRNSIEYNLKKLAETAVKQIKK
jgi:hypothetical protein